jgi:hypothetical protein
MPLIIDVVPTITPDLGPTVCIPIQVIQTWTTNANAFTLGWYGFMAGVAAVILVLIGYWVGSRYIVPRLLARWS